MSFQMLKRTRKRRGGDLYAGQLDPAIQAATELAAVLQKIKGTLPPDPNASTSAPNASNDAASSVPSASSASNSTNTDSSPASSPASSLATSSPELIKFKTGDKTGDKTGYIINGNILNTSEIKNIVGDMLQKTPTNQTLLNLNAVLNKKPSNDVSVIADALNAAKISYNPLNTNVFTMSGGTKKRRMRRTKRKTMRRTMKKSMRKTMRKY